MAKKSGPARATKIDAAEQARTQLKTIGCQKDRGKAELAKLKEQLGDKVARPRNTKVGGQKLSDAIDAFGLNFDGLHGEPVVKKKTTNILPNKLRQSRPNINEP